VTDARFELLLDFCLLLGNLPQNERFNELLLFTIVVMDRLIPIPVTVENKPNPLSTISF
jgi:hypothetical protein